MLLFALLAATAFPVGTPGCTDATSRDMDACLGRALDEADAAMTRYLAVAIGRVEKEKRRALARTLGRAQRSWLAYRHRECGAVLDWWAPGSYRLAAARSCEIRLTRDRTREIWSNWLTFADNSPPLLPRPATGEGQDADAR